MGIKSKNKSTFLFNYIQKLKKMDDDFIKKRLERDMAELKRLCEDHFAKRREDDAKMEELQDRIAKELEKQARLELMRAELAKEEAEKSAQQESRKAEIMAAMSGGYDKAAALAKRGEKKRLKRRSKKPQ